MVLNWQIKYLFEGVLYDWHALTDAEEIKILQKYANKGRWYTIYSGCKNKKYILYLAIIIFRNIITIAYSFTIVYLCKVSRNH